MTESEFDLDVDDVVAVKKVTKVTRTVEVSGDGDEKTVSKVTEVTTKVTEDGETKTTKEIVTEKEVTLAYCSS